MILFDYEKIYMLSYGRADLIVGYIKRMLNNPEAYPDLIGSSFILNTDVITKNPSKYDARTLAEYIGFLSIRNYQVFKETGDTSLSLMSLYPWIPREVLDSNPLVQLKVDKLIFEKENICLLQK